jgi:hypothetical protein
LVGVTVSQRVSLTLCPSYSHTEGEHHWMSVLQSHRGRTSLDVPPTVTQRENITGCPSYSHTEGEHHWMSLPQSHRLPNVAVTLTSPSDFHLAMDLLTRVFPGPTGQDVRRLRSSAILRSATGCLLSDVATPCCGPILRSATGCLLSDVAKSCCGPICKGQWSSDI